MRAARPDTWMPLYWGDYLRDTGRLTTEGHGAYLLLISDYWTSGRPLPDDDAQLAAIARLRPARWRRLRPVLAHFFEVAGGLWRHKRVERELERARLLVAERSAAGRAGAQARWRPKPAPAARPREPRTKGGAGLKAGAEPAKPTVSPDPRWRDPANRDAFAVGRCVPHLPGRDQAERWLVAIAAEDPAAPGHRDAVSHMLAASRRAGVGWVSPERRTEAALSNPGGARNCRAGATSRP
jgi:uncharacterized protein YdaU (DUF1376 family)